MLAYMIAPLARGDSPRWGTMSIVTASVIPGVGAAITVWKHHRYESYTQLSASLIVGGESAERQAFKFVEVHAQLQCECYLAVFVVVASVAGIIFFAAIAPGMQACAHATCGADVSWSAITLCGGVMWVVVLFSDDRRQRCLYFWCIEIASGRPALNVGLAQWAGPRTRNR